MPLRKKSSPSALGIKPSSLGSLTVLGTSDGRIKAFFNAMGLGNNLDDLTLLLNDPEEFSELAKDSFSYQGHITTLTPVEKR